MTAPARLPNVPPELRRIAIALPLPPRALSPNARGHWSKKAKATSEYRALAWAEASMALPSWRGKRPRLERAEIRATFFLPDERRRDPDNLMASLKAAYDGLTDAGILADDRGLVIHPPTLLLDRKRPRVELVISEAR